LPRIPRQEELKPRAREVKSGRSSATPFALLSIVGTTLLAGAILVTLLFIAVRAVVI